MPRTSRCSRRSSGFRRAPRDRDLGPGADPQLALPLPALHRATRAADPRGPGPSRLAGTGTTDLLPPGAGARPRRAARAMERVPVAHLARLGRKLTVVLDRPNRKRCELLVVKKPRRDGTGIHEQVFFRTESGIRAHRSRTRLVLAPPPASLAVVVDTAERYPWRFPGAVVSRRKLAAGDYALLDGERVAAVACPFRSGPGRARRAASDLAGDLRRQPEARESLDRPLLRGGRGALCRCHGAGAGARAALRPGAARGGDGRADPDRGARRAAGRVRARRAGGTVSRDAAGAAPARAPATPARGTDRADRRGAGRAMGSGPRRGGDGPIASEPPTAHPRPGPPADAPGRQHPRRAAPPRG